ncbi:MAG TPA: fused MFS/spermidine synthase [Ktedonobacteraceae bacterium]|nr:fused MFS/spermidine synthase [Ktedonobacteraceae bacterium]
MFTTTPDSGNRQVEEGYVAPTARRTFQGWLLIILVFVAGAASLAVEMAASRLLAPYFGTSLFVWANLIGLILLYLTIGYYVGGRLADRYPRPTVFYGLTAVAALLIALIPLISRPILSWSLLAFATYSVGVFYGSLVSVILLFAVPMILLGCVSPFAIRLRVEQVGKSGRTAGLLYAISTAGSIAGTFLPVLVFIPWIGTYRTFLVFAFALLVVSIVGLIVSNTKKPDEPQLLEEGKNSDKPQLPEKGKRVSKNLLSLLLLLPMLLSLLGLRGPIKPADGSNGGGVLLTERESLYNYIQVVRVGNETQLVLNEGVGIHSVYNPDHILTQGPWDYFMIAPYFNNPPFTASQVRRVCIIGLGAGTIPREMTAAYGSIPIDGIEIDGEIVNLARQYFAMNEPNLHVIVQDGRYYLRTTMQHYDIIGMDAYQQPYIPFQLTTSEFFHEVRDHLTPTGVAVVNVGRTGTDFRLVDALSQTMHTVFPNVYIIDSMRFTNSLVIGTNQPTELTNFINNTGQLNNPLLQSVAHDSIATGNLREETRASVYFTDDKAPVEQLIDAIIFNVVETEKK